MKKGYSSRGLFGNINHYDEHGKKIGESRPGLFGGYTNYDANGKKRDIHLKDYSAVTLITITTVINQATAHRNFSADMTTTMIKVRKRAQANRASSADTITKRNDSPT